MSSSSTWESLRRLFLTTCGDAAAAREEAWTHLSKGYRQVFNDEAVDVPELSAIDEEVVVAADADYIAMTDINFSVFGIQNVFNKTDGRPLDPEPGGMEGRDRFLTSTGTPPAGSITHYMRDGQRLYVRNVPTTETTLIVRVRREVPPLGDADIEGSPLTPTHLDHAIVFYAAASFFSLHPRMHEGKPMPDDERYRGLAKAEILGQVSPRVVEDKARRREHYRLSGYDLGPRWRR